MMMLQLLAAQEEWETSDEKGRKRMGRRVSSFLKAAYSTLNAKEESSFTYPFSAIRRAMSSLFSLRADWGRDTVEEIEGSGPAL